MQTFRSKKLMNEAVDLLKLFPLLGFPPDIVTFNILLAVCSENDDVEDTRIT